MDTANAITNNTPLQKLQQLATTPKNFVALKVQRYFREQQLRCRQTEPRKLLEQIAVCKFLIEAFCFTFVLQDSNATGSVNNSTGENSKERLQCITAAWT